MRVALVKPLPLGNYFRGAGFYGEHLSTALKLLPNLEVKVLPVSYSPLAYKNFDVVHFLSFDPFFLTLPPLRFTKTVITVYDLTPLVLPHLYPRGLRGEIKWQIQKRLVKTADALITLSEASKRDIEKILPIEKSKVFVTHLAPGDMYKKITDKNILEKVREKFNLSSPFIVYLGDVNRNKNLLGLVDAFAEARKKGLGAGLVLIGGAAKEGSTLEAIELRERIKHYDLENEVVLTGFASDDEVVAIFNLATAYVQPSVYEGFGLPVIQALACGKPVICGRHSSLPEVAGNAAIYTDVKNPEVFAKTLKEIDQLSGKKLEIIEAAALRQAAKFTWEKTASQTLKVYGKVLSR